VTSPVGTEVYNKKFPNNQCHVQDPNLYPSEFKSVVTVKLFCRVMGLMFYKITFRV